MRKIISLLAICCAISSCGSSASEEDRLEAATEMAQRSEVTETELFLGFRFGMTDEQITEHLVDLEHAGKIYVDREGAYAYDFHTGATTIKLTFRPRYYNEELYWLDFAMSTHENGVGSPELNTVLGAKTFLETDNAGFQSFITEYVPGETIYTFIKKNLIIQFVPFGGGVMSYINAPIDRTRREEGNAQMDSDKNRTLSDF